MLFVCFRSLVLASLLGLGLGAGLVAQEQGHSDKDRISEVAKKVIDGLNRKDVDKAFSAMTSQGFEQFAGMYLMELASFVSADVPPGMPAPPVPEELKKVAAKFGLENVKLPEMDMATMTAMASKPPEEQAKMMVEMQAKVERQLLAAVKPEVLRDAVAEIAKELGASIGSPQSLELGAVAVQGDRAEVAVNAVMAPEFAEAGGDAGPTVAMFMILSKKDDKWLFDGFDQEKVMQLMLSAVPTAKEFKEIEGLEIAGKTIEDKAVSLADYKGKVVLVDFWGTWCGPCVASLPELKELHEEFHAKGFEILGVAADDADTLKDFLSETQLPWSSVVDGDTEIAAKYEIEAFPTTLLVDQKGRHVATNLHGDTLRKALELLLAGKSIKSITGSAAEILEEGAQQAIQEKKLVFLHFGADWCGPCKGLESWMSLPEIRSRLDKVFVDVKADVDHNFGARELMTSLDPKAVGIPWYAFMDPAADKVLANCEAESVGNIGLPNTEEGFNHFVKMFEATGRFTKEDLELFRKTIVEIGNGSTGEAEKK